MVSHKWVWKGKCLSTVQRALVSSNAESNHDMNRLSDRKSPMADTSLFFVRGLMENVESRTLRTSADLISSILNWVCPECGGRMGGLGNEFMCHGKCKINWRPVWERVIVNAARQRMARGRGRFRCQ
jgi:hypothetical protein